MHPYQEKKVRPHYVLIHALQWLSFRFYIDYKVLLMTFKTLNDLGTKYLPHLLKQHSLSQALRLAYACVLLLQGVTQTV